MSLRLLAILHTHGHRTGLRLGLLSPQSPFHFQIKDLPFTEAITYLQSNPCDNAVVSGGVLYGTECHLDKLPVIDTITRQVEPKGLQVVAKCTTKTPTKYYLTGTSGQIYAYTAMAIQTNNNLHQLVNATLVTHNTTPYLRGIKHEIPAVGTLNDLFQVPNMAMFGLTIATLTKIVEQWITDYNNPELEKYIKLFGEDITYDIYRGDYIHHGEIDKDKCIHIRNGLTSWSVSPGVAAHFAEEHYKNFIGELESEGLSDEEIDDELALYRYVVIVLQGTKRVIDLERLGKSLALIPGVQDTINKEEERILILPDDQSYTIERMNFQDQLIYVYINTNNPAQPV